MAVYQGARLRSEAVARPEAPVRRARPSVPATGEVPQRVRPVGLLMATIAAATLVGMVYLTQTLGTNAASTAIDRLEVQRNELIKEIKRHEVVALTMTQAEDIVPLARDQKLKRLGEPKILPAP